MRRPDSAPRGQVLLIVALGIVVLLAAAGIAIDVGRVMAERRHLQTAADAGALAACQSLISGAVPDISAAEVRARSVAQVNLVGSPAGATGTMAAPPVYEDEDGSGLIDPDELTSGVVVSSSSARVAIASTVDTILARVVGIGNFEVGARAQCELVHPPALPIVVRRYDDPGGPGFTDVLATVATSHDGEVDSDPLGYDGRTPASEADPGPQFEIYGTLSKALNSAEFRGFVVLDIRDFTDETERKYYNGVLATDSEATLKAKESEYILTGYPGPAFPAATSPPTGALQVATLPGHNSDDLVHQFADVYVAGDRILLGVYDGTVKSIPDFSITPPSELVLPSSTGGTPVDGPSFKVSSNAAFVGTASLQLLGDAAAADPADNILPVSGNGPPAAGEMNEPIFNPDDFTPAGGSGTTVIMEDISTNAVDPGIYTVWLKGTSSTPNKGRRHPIPVHVGGATKDFNLDNSTLSGAAANLGDVVTFDIRVRSESWGGGDVALSWDAVSLTDCVLNPVVAPGTMSVVFSPSLVAPSNGQGTLSTLTVDTDGLASGCYKLPIRAKGTNGDGQPVTHLAPITLYVVQDPSDGSYVDILGFAMFEVDSVIGNTIKGHAISQICADPNCGTLRTVQRARLIPWS